MVKRAWWSALGAVAAAMACSSSSNRPVDALGDSPPMADTFLVDAPSQISTGSNTNVTCLRADATSVYWSSGFVPSYVWKAPVAGGNPALLATDDVEDACVKALDATNVYYSDGVGSVLLVAVNGGSPEHRGPDWLGYLTSNGQYLIQEFYNTGTELWITPVADGSATAWQEYIGINSLSNLASDATYTYFTGETTVSGPYSISRVPIGSDFNPTIESLYTVPTGYALGGGMPPSYPSQLPTAAFAIDAQNLYIVQMDTSTGATQILQRTIVGTDTPITLVDDQHELVNIAIDGTDVYWSAKNGSTTAVIQRVPIGGGSPTTVATDTSGYFALGPTHIAWSAPGTIYVVPK